MTESNAGEVYVPFSLAAWDAVVELAAEESKTPEILISDIIAHARIIIKATKEGGTFYVGYQNEPRKVHEVSFNGILGVVLNFVGKKPAIDLASACL